MKKYILVLFLLLFSAISFAQSTGLIVGNILDEELENTPLAFANVSLKGTDFKTTTDLTGLFFLENIADGEYTLVCSFVGYQSKEIKIKVSAEKPTEVLLYLGAQTLAFNKPNIGNPAVLNYDTKADSDTKDVVAKTAKL